MRAALLLLSLPWLQALPQTGQNSQVSQPSLQQGQEQFTRRILQQIEATAAGNFVLSPHSLHSTFSQLLQGSGGRTQAELESVLGVRSSPALGEQYRSLGAGLAGGNATLRQANLLAVAPGFKPKAAYRGSLTRGFQSDIQEFDFCGDSAGALGEINKYVEDATNQKIKDLLAEDDVDCLTRMVLINAVYFKATWKFAFDAFETFSSTFNSPAGGVETQYMSREASVRVLEDKERQLDILELPYNDPTKAMLIILPKAGVSSEGLVQRLAGLDLDSVRTQGRLDDTAIFIPRFKLKYQTYLRQPMETLGTRDLFSLAANLTGISDEALSVSEGVHQAFIEVNEEGTEAAAATAAVVGLRTARQKRQFFADRPFLFVVYDFQQGVALFAGKVVDPSNGEVIERKANFASNVASPPTVGGDPRGDPEACARYSRDFPNALDNANICQKVESERKLLDWLRINRATCEDSKNLFDGFMSNSCGLLWCLEMTPLLPGWRREAESELCLGIQSRVETDEVKRDCKTARNRVKAAEFLNCK